MTHSIWLRLRAWRAILLIISILVLVQVVQPALGKKKKPLTCFPANGVTQKQCKIKVADCPAAQGIIMKWTGVGCRSPVTKKAMRDGGCQCNHYCGYSCQSACNADPQCRWSSGQCIVELTGLPGVKMPTCYTVTPRPTQSPTTSRPSASPTTSRPTRVPSSVPTRSPTTSRPTTSPTTSRPSLTPSNVPTKSPTPPTPKPSRSPTNSPTKHPSASPTTSRPSRNPTTSRPSRNPTTSRPSKNPTNSVPTQSPTTSVPTLSPSTRSPTPPTTRMPSTRSPTTKAPSTACGSCPSGKSCQGALCVGLGNLQISMFWNRVGQMQMWVYPPTTGTFVGEDNTNMPNALSAFGQQDANNAYGFGPNNVFWDSSRTPPPGTYKICATTFYFYPSSEEVPVVVNVTITRPLTVGGPAIRTVGASINVDSYIYTSPECAPVGASDSSHSFGYFVGSFVYPFT